MNDDIAASEDGGTAKRMLGHVAVSLLIAASSAGLGAGHETYGRQAF